MTDQMMHGNGIMDQMISARGLRDHALLLDCRSLEGKLVSLPSNFSMVVLDTGTRRGLVDSAYNQRRVQCSLHIDKLIAAGVKYIKKDINYIVISAPRKFNK